MEIGEIDMIGQRSLARHSLNYCFFAVYLHLDEQISKVALFPLFLLRNYLKILGE